MRLVIIAAIFLAAVGTLVGVGLKEGSVPVRTFDQLLGSEPLPERFILDGARIASIESTTPLRFTVAAPGYEDRPVRVEADLAPPENFNIDGPVRVWGRYSRETGVLTATKLTTQCPSRYSAEQDLDRIQKEKRAELEAREVETAP